MAPFRRSCDGCNEPMPGKHLRVNFSPPDEPWIMQRFHDLQCLFVFLEKESDGPHRLVFHLEQWRGTVPRA